MNPNASISDGVTYVGEQLSSYPLRAGRANVFKQKRKMEPRSWKYYWVDIAGVDAADICGRGEKQGGISNAPRTILIKL